MVRGPTNDIASARQLPPSERLATSLTAEAYADTFRTTFTPHWQQSLCLQRLTRIFEQQILTADNITLTKCVCLGLGSLTAGTPTSSYELAVLISVLQILGVY